MPSPREDQILDYLNDQLTAAERATFEQALATDDELRQEVELQRIINERLRQKRLEDQLRPLVKKAKQAHSQASGKVASRRLARLLALAAAAVVVLLSGWFIFRPAPDYPQQLALKYQQKNPPAAVLPSSFLRNNRNDLKTSAPPTAAEPVKVARYYLAAGEFEKALLAYQRIPDAALTDSLRFETSVLHLQLGQAQTALDILRKVPAAPFDGGTFWYQALAYLQLGELDSARTQVQRLLEEYPGTYRTDAVSLMEEL